MEYCVAKYAMIRVLKDFCYTAQESNVKTASMTATSLPTVPMLGIDLLASRQKCYRPCHQGLKQLLLTFFSCLRMFCAHDVRAPLAIVNSHVTEDVLNM